MATSTTNLNLIKPSGSDKIRIAQINQNMDLIDAAIGAVGTTSLQAQILAIDSGLAVVSTGNTHVALTSGQYVYIRNHSSLSEGLYKATAAISANATLSTSNVTKVLTGGMNELKSAINSVNSQIIEYTTMTNGTELNSLTTKANYMVGNIAQMGHAPTGCGSSGFFYVDIKSPYILQRFFGNLGSAHRFSYDGGSNWVNWFDPNGQLWDMPILKSGYVEAGGTITITIASRISMHEGYALLSLNYIGESIAGCALLYLGRGTGKVKDLIGSMTTSNYTATYANGVWSIVNNGASNLYYAAIITQ